MTRILFSRSPQTKAEILTIKQLQQGTVEADPNEDQGAEAYDRVRRTFSESFAVLGAMCGVR
jgi:hypothetical protein